MTAEERSASLEEQLTQALEQLRVTQEELAVSYQRIEELEKQKTPPPAFVKANVKKPAAEGNWNAILTRFLPSLRVCTQK
jgi:hypothetical protein